MEPSFRLAAPADLELLLSLIQEYYRCDGHSFDEAALRGAVEAFLRDDSLGQVWMICDGDAAAGYIVLALGYSFEYLGRDAFVDEFFLYEVYRGKGWGRQALHHVEEQARRLGVRALHLEVKRGNPQAERLYRSFGFEHHDRTLMTKRLNDNH